MVRMRCLVGCVAAVLLFVACGGSSQSVVPTANVRVVNIENDSAERGVTDTLRFGRMRSGEVIAQTIRVQNNSTEPIVLTRHHVSCGCLKVRYSRQPIAPGASGDIALEFDSRTMLGLQLKTLVLYFAEKGRPMRIFVEAEVE